MSSNSCGEITTRGTILQRRNPDSGVWEVVDYVVGMPEPSINHATAVCNNDAYAAGVSWEQLYKTGKLKAGPMTFTLNWRPDNPLHRALRADVITTDLRDFRIQYPDPNLTTTSAKVAVTDYGRPSPPDGGKFTNTITMAPSGELVEAAA